MDFHEWLRLQECRDDRIGELAHTLLADPLSPFWSRRLVTFRTFLVYRETSKELMDALESAFVEWRHYS